MGVDDRETETSNDEPTATDEAGAFRDEGDVENSAGKKLSPRVERALQRAREAARRDSERKEGRWLASIPIGIGLVVLALMMPHATEPDSIPLPAVDHRAVARVVAADDAHARAVSSEPLPSDIRNVGSAFRALNAAEASGADAVQMSESRRLLDLAIREVVQRPTTDDDLLALRAFQMTSFLDALRHWEASGESSNDLIELSGNFIHRSTDAGWVEDRHLIMTEDERRVAFKTVWNAAVGVDKRDAFAITLDEQRLLYAFYLTHPHPIDSRRASLRIERRDATTRDACDRVNAEERRQAELWRVDKIRKLAAIDPSYPASYAMGVAFFRAGRFDLSAEAFNTFLSAHPDGPYALRARNHLKAALAR